MNLQEIEIAKQLINDPRVRARQLKIVTQEGILILEGQVESYFAKQMAQETIRELDGVNTIENRLQVIV